MTANNLREQISQLVAQYANEALSPKPFVAGTSVVPPSGKVIGAKELQLMVEASLDGWLTTGRFNDAFEKNLGIYWGSSCFNDNIWLFGKLAGTDCADFPKIRRASSQTRVMRLLLSLLASRLQLTRRSRMV